jgi:hypothetical protein
MMEKLIEFRTALIPRAAFPLAALACYAASLCLPSIGSTPGAGILVAGILSILYLPVVPYLCMAWVANFTLMVSLYRGLRARDGLRWGAASVLLAAPLFVAVCVLQGTAALGPKDPGRPGAGFWLWFAAIAISYAGHVRARPRDGAVTTR